jgi:hypothetical protein
MYHNIYKAELYEPLQHNIHGHTYCLSSLSIFHFTIEMERVFTIIIKHKKRIKRGRPSTAVD